mmetsp:Transcript_5540/g.9656  ORF Transcript_5540/g.9656 Transcript_5540/m.9656 type:complete len:129 (-) Transcript_5540:16-402(-)
MAEEIKRLSPSEFAPMLLKDRGEVQVIDVRDEDYEGGHIPGCRNVPAFEFERRVEGLAKEFAGTEKLLVFHCWLSQQRGPTCARRMLEYLAANHPDHKCKVGLLEGGFCRWQAEYGGKDNWTQYIAGR